VPSSLRPMLLTSATTPPTGDGRVHEAKLDGWRCLVEVSGGRVQVWSRHGGDYTARLPELQSLSGLEDSVIDGSWWLPPRTAEPTSNCCRLASTAVTAA
jgi:bifunctional non-homologous end joining protein LigD